MPPTDPSSPYMTVPEAAVLLRTTAKALYRRLDRHQLPGVVHFGRRVLIRRQDLVESLIEVRVPPTKGGTK